MTRRRKRAWGPSNALWRWQHRHSRSSTPRRTKVHTMARRRYGRRYGRRSGGFGLGRLLTVRNLMFTVVGAFAGSKLMGNGQLGAAAGGFMGAGLPGAIAGYFVGAPIANAVGGMVGGSASSSGSVW